MDVEVGAIVAGKINGIIKFGAFVTIAPGISGLVHISEITSTFVNDVRDHLTEGQDVMVKIMGVDESGRLNLSIKAAAAESNKEPEALLQEKPQSQQQTTAPTFEDKLKRFMKDSDSKMHDMKQYSDKKGARRRGR